MEKGLKSGKGEKGKKIHNIYTDEIMIREGRKGKRGGNKKKASGCVEYPTPPSEIGIIRKKTSMLRTALKRRCPLLT